MVTLLHHTLIYDRDCPMCRLYTGAFIRQGWLDDKGRKPYSEINESDFCGLDRERAKDEIALINRVTGEVTYGVDGLLRIITSRWPRLDGLLAHGVIRWMLRRLYFFISYNRKVIAAVRPSGKPCSPSFHAGYRLAYLLVTFLIVSAVLAAFAPLMSGLVPQGSSCREYLICGGQILFQGVVLLLYQRGRLMDYLGNMMTVSLMGALALLPLLAISFWVNIPAVIAAGYFLLVAGGMLLEHLRRMKLLGLGWLPSLTWVLYRSLVLLILLG